MIEEMKCACIRVCSCTNEWMDCIFLVDEKDKEIATSVLKEAWDDLWEDGEDQCFGDFLGMRLAEAGIQFDVYHAKAEEEDANE